ncbi:MAG TPA: DUF6541 family protein [Thermoanaerobaculia bacterium]
MNPAGPILAAAVFVLPGAVFVRRREWERAEPAEIAGIAFAASAAFWAVSFWLLHGIRVSLSLFAASVLSASVLAFAIRGRRSARAAAASVRPRRAEVAWQLCFVLIVLALRLVFPSTRIAYSGGDMTAHAATAEEIVLANGFPKSQEPLSPVSRFGEVSPGFHVLSALVSLFTGMTTYRSTIWVMSAAMAGATLTLYALLRSLSLPAAAAAAGSAGALLLARNPQFFMQWGGAPSILAAAILFLLLRDAFDLGAECDALLLGRAALLAAGAFLVHILPVIAFAWLVLPALLFRSWAVPGYGRNLLRNGPIVVLGAAILALPFLLQAPLSVSPQAVAWARNWFPSEIHGALRLQDRFSPLRGRGAGVWSWPFYLVTYLGILPAAILVSGLVIGWIRKRASAGISVWIVVGNLILFAAAFGELLPGWPALYPTRIGLFLAVPMAVAAAEIFLLLAGTTSGRVGRASLAVIAAGLFLAEGARLSTLRYGTAFYESARSSAGSLLAIPLNEAMGGAFWVATFCRDNSAVTRDDLSAFEWIRAQTPAASVFANNPGDGGCLIPAAAHRKIFDSHYYWFFDAPEMEAWKARTEVDYVFVGSDPAPPWATPWTAERLDRDERVELVRTFGRSRVYQVREPFRARFR